MRGRHIEGCHRFGGFVVDVVSIDSAGSFSGEGDGPKSRHCRWRLGAQGEDGRSRPYSPRRQRVSSSLITFGTTSGITHGIVHAS